MSLIGDLAFSDQRALEQEALDNPAISLPEPSFWDGGLDAVGDGLGRGAFEAATSIEAGFNNLWTAGLDAAAGVLLPEPRGGGTPNVTEREQIFREGQSVANAEMISRLRPSAETSGLAAQIINEVSAVIPRTVGGFIAAGPIGGAIAAGGPAGYSGEIVAESEGIDPSTARKKGLIDAATYGIGAVLPAARIMKSVMPDLAVTTAANVGLGVASRGGIAALLEANGYTQQAQQYKALDGTGLIVDAVLGAAFWGAGRAFRPSAGDIDAGLAANNGLHHQNGTAPGAPVDPRSSIAHQTALDQAIAQLSRGEPVSIGGIADDATFIRTDQIGPGREAARHQAEQEVFAEARAELEKVAASGLPNVRDLHAELGALTKTVDSLDGTYRELAKTFQRQGMSRKQAERAARESIAEQRQGAQTRMNEINQALEGNRAAERAGADLAAMDRGQVPDRFASKVDERAKQIISAFKRTALASSVAPDHGASLMRAAGKEMEKLLREGGHIVDDIEVSPVRDLDTSAQDAAARHDREASRAVESATPPGLAVRPGDARADAEPQGQPSQEAPAPGPGKAPSTVAADPLADIDTALPALVDSIVAGERDVQVPTGAFNEDGSVVTMSAREMLAEADGDIARAENDSKGFIAAALCALRFGN